jgi:hypothetical protein
MSVEKNQAQVVLVGCGAPNRGMGWYHAVQMLKKKCPSAVLSFIVEPWFLGGGKSSQFTRSFRCCLHLLGYDMWLMLV